MSQDMIAVIASFFGSLGFAAMYNTRGKRLLGLAFGGAAAWGLYLVIYARTGSDYLGYFLVAVFATFYGEIWARILKTPVTTVLIPTVVPLIPGGTLYYAMDHLLHRRYEDFAHSGFNALGLAVSLAAGIMVVTSLYSPIYRLIRRCGRKCAP